MAHMHVDDVFGEAYHDFQNTAVHFLLRIPCLLFIRPFHATLLNIPLRWPPLSIAIASRKRACNSSHLCHKTAASLPIRSNEAALRAISSSASCCYPASILRIACAMADPSISPKHALVHDRADEMEDEPRKRKRTRLTIAAKIEAAKMMKAGTTVNATAKHFQCSVRAAKRIKQQADDLIATAASNPKALTAKSQRQPLFPIVEEKLLNYLLCVRALRVSVSNSVLQAKTMQIRQHFLTHGGLEDRHKEALELFQVSDGWLGAFVRRNDIHPRLLHGEDRRVDVDTLTRSIGEFRSKIKGYRLECIYTVDNPLLYYRLFPRKSYFEPDHHGKVSTNGLKSMMAMDRLTAYLCCNVDGSRKLPVSLIGTSKDPLWFRFRNNPRSPYLCQQQACADRVTFRHWFFDVFIPYIRNVTKRPVALVLDENVPHEKDLEDPDEQVQLISLPSAFTNRQEPMRNGLITEWRHEYRHELLTRMIDEMDDREERRKASGHLRADLLGMSEGHNPSLLDASEIASTAWDAISSYTIAKHWQNCEILTHSLQADLTNIIERYDDVLEKDRSQSLAWFAKLYDRFIASIPEYDPLRSVVEPVSYCDIERWVDLEIDEEVQEALANDLLDELLGLLPIGDDAEGQNSHQNSLDITTIPPPGSIHTMFNTLEEMALKFETYEALAFLRKAKTSFVKASRNFFREARQQIEVEEYPHR